MDLTPPRLQGRMSRTQPLPPPTSRVEMLVLIFIVDVMSNDRMVTFNGWRQRLSSCGHLQNLEGNSIPIRSQAVFGNHTREYDLNQPRALNDWFKASRNLHTKLSRVNSPKKKIEVLAYCQCRLQNGGLLVTTIGKAGAIFRPLVNQLISLI